MRRAAQRITRSRRAVWARGKPTRIELYTVVQSTCNKCMNEGGCSAAGLRARHNPQLAKLIVAGASELVDVQGEAKLLVKNDPQVSCINQPYYSDTSPILSFTLYRGPLLCNILYSLPNLPPHLCPLPFLNILPLFFPILIILFTILLICLAPLSIRIPSTSSLPHPELISPLLQPLPALLSTPYLFLKPSLSIGNSASHPLRSISSTQLSSFSTSPSQSRSSP